MFKFGLTADVDPKGIIHIITENVDEVEIAKGKRYILMGRIGVSLIVAGSVLQIAAVWM